MTKEVIEFGRTLAKARAELDKINRRGEGHFDPREEYRTLHDDVNDFHDLPSRNPDPDPAPIVPFLVMIAATVVAIAIGYGMQTLWLGGM